MIWKTPSANWPWRWVTGPCLLQTLTFWAAKGNVLKSQWTASPLVYGCVEIVALPTASRMTSAALGLSLVKSSLTPWKKQLFSSDLRSTLKPLWRFSIRVFGESPASSRMQESCGIYKSWSKVKGQLKWVWMDHSSFIFYNTFFYFHQMLDSQY